MNIREIFNRMKVSQEDIATEVLLYIMQNSMESLNEVNRFIKNSCSKDFL